MLHPGVYFSLSAKFDILRQQGVPRDEFPTRLDLIAPEGGEELLRDDRILAGHPNKPRLAAGPSGHGRAGSPARFIV